MDMLCLMFECDRRGYLQSSNGRPFSHEQIARMTGCSSEEVSRLIGELETSGVFSRTKAGVIFSRRQVRDEENRADGRIRQHNHRNSQKQKENSNGDITHNITPLSQPSSSSISTSIKPSRATCEEIYLAYPRHIGKEAAIVAIEKALRKSKIEPAAMLALVTAYAQQREGAEGHPQFTPHPATWFNQGRYADETLQPKPKLIWEKVN